MAENLAALDPPAPDGDVVHPLVGPDPRPGRHRGAAPASLAPNGCVVKVAGHRRAAVRGHAHASSTARSSRWRRSSPGRIKPGDVVVIRYEGPKGGPGHARDARGHRRDEGRRARRRRRARHRRPLLRRHARLLRRATSRPRRSTAARSRSCADGDRIVIDAEAHTIDLARRRRRARRGASELEAARAALHQRLPRQVRPARAGRRDAARSPTSESSTG